LDSWQDAPVLTAVYGRCQFPCRLQFLWFLPGPSVPARLACPSRLKGVVGVSDNTGRVVVMTPFDMTLPAPRRRRILRQQWDLLAVIAAGGALGAALRYGISVTWPAPAGGFPRATLAINVLGCALIGVLMVLITDVWVAHRLVRPFLGTGFLGGFTTFSTYGVESERLITGGAARTGLVYLVVTPIAALAAVWVAVVITRQVVRQAVRRVPHEADR
jgi:CrcB protein